MFKHHNINCFGIGLLYAVVLGLASAPRPAFLGMAVIFLLFCVAAGYYNRRYLQLIKKYNFWVLLRLTMLYFAGFCVFSLLPAGLFRGLFLVSAFFLVSLFELMLGDFAENLALNETLLVAFGLLTGLTAAAQYFPDFHQVAVFLGHRRLLNWRFSLLPLYLLGVFAVTLLLARAFYEFVPRPDKTKWAGAAALGLFCGELFWALGFLPFHYSAQAAVLLSLFYFCLILNYYHLFHVLSLKKIQYHLILISLAIVLVVAATPWKIIA